MNALVSRRNQLLNQAGPSGDFVELKLNVGVPQNLVAIDLRSAVLLRTSGEFSACRRELATGRRELSTRGRELATGGREFTACRWEFLAGNDRSVGDVRIDAHIALRP